MSAWLHGWARKVLAPETYARTMGAAAADVAHEVARADAAQRKRIERSARWMYVRVLIGALMIDRGEARKGVRWWLMVVPVLAVVAGALGVASAEGGRLPLAQLAFLATGLVVAALLATTPRRVLAHEATGAGWIGVAMIALVPLAGRSLEGSARWLAIGPLLIQVAVLVLPFVALGLTRLASERKERHATLLVIAAQAAIVATADLASALTFAVVAVAAGGSWRGAVARGVLAGAGVAIAASLDPMLAPVAHSEGIVGLLAGHVGLLVLALAGLAAAIAVPVVVAWRTRDAWARAMGLAVAAGIAVPVLAGLVIDAPVPLLGYSGSAVVAVYVGLGSLMALRASVGRASSAATSRFGLR